jgi:prophage regulatory protein
MQITLLRLPAVLALTGLKKTTLYALIKRGEFPSPISLTKRTKAWPSNEIYGWIDSRVSAARGGAQ